MSDAPPGRWRPPAWLWPERLGRLDVETAVRATFCAVLPMALLLAAGRNDLLVYTAFASFTALYGRGERYSDRARTLALAGATFLLVIILAMLASAMALATWQLAGCLALLAALGVLLSERMQWVPFGGTFLVFAFAVVASVPVTLAEMPLRLSLSVATVALCWMVGMSGFVLRRVAASRPAQRLPLRGFAALRTVARRRAAWSDPVVWWTAGEAALGVLLAIALVKAFGLGHAYWAAVSVVACMPRPYARSFRLKTAHRIAGTTLGVVVAGALLGLQPPVWVLVLAVGVFQFATEIFVGRVYWLAAVFITPLALVVGYLAQVSALAPLLVDRLFDTLIGGAALLLVEFAGRPVALALVRRTREPGAPA